MANPISSKDLFKGSLFGSQAKDAQSLAESVRMLISALEGLKTPIKKAAEESKKFTDSVNLKNIDTKKLIQLEKEYEKLKKGLSDTEKINKQLKKSQVELVEATEDQTKSEKDLLKEKLKQQKANREQAKQLKALITLEDKLGKELKDQADVLENLEEITKLTGKTRDEQREISQALRTVVGGLSEDYEDQADAIERLNETIDRNDKKIKENADSYLAQKINIGNYAESVKDALGETELFNTGIGKLDQILNAITGRLAKAFVSVVAYEKSTEGAARSTTFLGRANQFLSKTFRNVGKALKASGIGAIIVALGSFAAAISTNRKEALEFQILLARVGNFVSTLITRLGKASGAFLKLGKTISGVVLVQFGLVVKAVSTIGKAINLLPDKINIGFGMSIDLPSVKIPDKVINSLDKFAGFTFDSVKGLGDIPSLIGEITRAFDGLGKSLEATDKLQIELLRNQFDFADQERIINREIANTNKQREIAQALSDDDTDSLQNIIKFRQKAERLAEKELALKIDLAKKELSFTEKQLAIELNRADAEGATAEEIRNLVLLDEKRFLASETALQAQQEALLKIKELEKERDLLSLENINKRVKAEQDLFEQNLDFLIDVAEKNRSLIEGQIAETTRSVEERVSLFSKLQNQLSVDIQNQLGEFNNFADELAESVQQKLSAGFFVGDQIKEAEEQFKTLSGLDLRFEFVGDELKLFNKDVELTEGSIIELNKKLQSLGLGEIPVNRLLEVLRDGTDARKEITLLGDEVERLAKLTSKELKSEEIVSKESLDRIKELNAELQTVLNAEAKNPDDLKKQLEEIERIQSDISNVEKEAQNESLKNRIEAIDRELELIDKESTDAIELRTERNEIEKKLIEDKLANQVDAAQKAANKEIENANKAADKEIEIANEKAKRLKAIEEGLFSFIEESTTKQFENKIQLIDKEIEANNLRQQELQALANLGSENAKENLAFEKQRARELELERKKTQESQARTELFLALLKATTANITNGDDPQVALVKALGTSTVLQKAANVLSIPGFFNGTENVTSKDAEVNRKTAKDPFLIWAHPNERIIDHKKNAQLAGYSNQDIVDIVKSYDGGMMLPQHATINNYSIDMPSILIEEMRAIKEAFPRFASELDRHTGILTTAIYQGNKVTRNKRRTQP